jgi:2-succinyl-5-enolpyruvyl-6-hydroxy-3-cyclohexene-1-carboxylate synthase
VTDSSERAGRVGKGEPVGSEPALAQTAQTEWMRVLARTLRDAGIERVVASPGSRSTPVLAAVLAAGLEVIDVVDERVASFIALGHGRATGRPAAVLCTSGTAPAHWFAAVLEASLANVPMVLLSANRPTELSLCGAPQTVDQTKLFGEHVRFFADTGNPEASERSLVGLRRVVAQAVSASLGPRPGPVHLDVRARKPLEPREPGTRAEHALRATADAVLARPAPSVRATVVPAAAELAALEARLAEARRVLFVAGPLPCHVDSSALTTWVQQRRGVLAAELTSQLRFSSAAGFSGAGRLDSLDAWLTAGLFDGHQEAPPDLVLELGAVPTSAAYERWVARARPRRVVVGAASYLDPHGGAEQILVGDAGEIARALLVRGTPATSAEDTSTAGFVEQLTSLEAAGASIAREVAEGGWGEPAIAREVVRALPEGARLVVGNSLPIRMLDRYATRELRSASSSFVVQHQRGANGIDGLVAQSFGATLADPRPTVALLGDLTFLHDVGALATARRSRAPLCLVLVDNDGGRIFEALPVAREAPWMMSHMITSEPLDHEALARAYGVAFESVSSGSNLAAALDRGLARPGLSIVRACVEPRGARAFEAELARRHGIALEEARKGRRWRT